jgi:hypothetical protein
MKVVVDFGFAIVVIPITNIFSVVSDRNLFEIVHLVVGHSN